VALTFDDGPDPQVTPRVLDLLDRYQARATFFVIGAKAARHPELVRELAARGHTLGNHSQTHPPFLMLQGKRAIAREVALAQAAIRAAGAEPLAFRPPVGITSPDLWRVLAGQGLACVNFSCRARDLGNRRVPGLAGRMLATVRAGDILLLHDTRPHRVSEDALLVEFERLLQGLADRQLPVRPLAELLGPKTLGGPGAPRVDAVFTLGRAGFRRWLRLGRALGEGVRLAPPVRVLLAGAAVRLPGDAVCLPGDDVRLSGYASHLPGEAVRMPGDAVRLPGDDVRLSGYASRLPGPTASGTPGRGADREGPAALCVRLLKAWMGGGLVLALLPRGKA
jgi:peptidoglycan/xylan/chitin deacetylase (PgdA/CDA1 family)